MPNAMTPQDVLRFWFEEIQPAQWWKVDPALDHTMATRFAALHTAAQGGELWEWRVDAHGRLAEIVVLDQFSRNLFRGTARAFASDAVALVLAQECVAGRHDQALPPERRAFVYMPLMHSESRAVHTHAEALFVALGSANSLDFERRHKAIVDRFGRYPHRNEALGRASTPDELVFLSQPGSRF